MNPILLYRNDTKLPISTDNYSKVNNTNLGIYQKQKNQNEKLLIIHFLWTFHIILVYAPTYIHAFRKTNTPELLWESMENTIMKSTGKHKCTYILRNVCVC